MVNGYGGHETAGVWPAMVLGWGMRLGKELMGRGKRQSLINNK